MHPLLPNWKTRETQCCGNWTQNGDFYLFLKVFFHKFKTPIVSWDGYSWTPSLISPQSIFLGPIGEFFVTTGSETTSSGAIWQGGPPPSGQSTQWIGDISLDAGSYTFWVQNMDSVVLTARGFSQSLPRSCGGPASPSTVSIPAKGTYTLTATLSACRDATLSQPSSVWWTQDGQAATLGLGGTSGYTSNTTGTGVTTGRPACGVQSWMFETAWSASQAPALYQCENQVELALPAGQPANSQPAVNAPEAGLWVEYTGDLPLDLSTQEVAFFLSGNAPRQDSGCGTVNDTISVEVANASGSFSQTWNGPLGATGTALWIVDSQPGLQGPVSFLARYHSPYAKDFPSCTLAQASDASFSLAVGPVGQWLVQTACTAGAPITHVNPGPTDPAQGTLAGGSLFTEDYCQAQSLVPSSEQVVGVYDFGTSGGGNYDFFVGATVSESYKFYLDGTLVASRTVGAGDMTGIDCYPTTKQCATREKHLVLSLTPGYHVIEAFFDNETGAAPPTNGSEHRIRWSPVVPNQGLVSFYASQTELTQAIYGVNGTYTAVEPLMVLKYPMTGSVASQLLGFSWSNLPQDCNTDPGVNGQLDCGNSLLAVEGQPAAFSAVWDGTYALADQVPYFFQIDSGGGNNRQVDLWVDGQQYFQFQPGYWPFPDSGQLLGFVQNSAPPTDATVTSPPPGAGVNRLRFVTFPLLPETATAKFNVQWVQRNPYDYAVAYLDVDGNLVGGGAQFGNYGPPQGQLQAQQMFTASGGGNVPSGTCNVYLIAPPVGDPLGLYYVGSGTSAIDLVAGLAASPGQQQAPGNVFDLCVNGTCSFGNTAPVTGAASTQVSSPSFLTYSQNLGQPTQNSGLFSQQPYNVIVNLYGGSKSLPGCLVNPAAASYGLTLGYQAHQWGP